MKQGKIKGNPFQVYIDKLSKSPTNGRGLLLSFTRQEKDIIVKTFYDNPYPSHYFGEIVDNLFNDGLIENDLTYYCTRHYFATQLIRSGLDIATVAAWLGDNKSTVMDYYYAADYSMVVPSIL